MILKTSKRGSKKEKQVMNTNDKVHCCIIDCHGNSLLHLIWIKTLSCEGLLGGVFKFFWTSISQWLCRVR